MCLSKLPKGDIILVAGGTGLFPFLDLLDIIFKIVVSGKVEFS
jgi:NAD(P)H-flavin reductase